MKRSRHFTFPILVIAAVSIVVPLLAADEPADGIFDAVAEVTSSQGTRSMPLAISVNTPLAPQDAAYFRETLDHGGQPALLNAIRNAVTGRLVLGTMEYPINLIVAERIDDGWKYTIVTARNINWQELSLEEHSLDYPFTVARFEIEDGRRGDGTLAPKAALSISPDGQVSIETFEGARGRLKEIKRRSRSLAPW